LNIILISPTGRDTINNSQGKMIGKNIQIIFICCSSLQLLFLFGFSSAMSVSAGPTQSTCAVVGVGVLGTSLCKQLIRDPDFKHLKGTCVLLLWLGLIDKKNAVAGSNHNAILPNTVLTFFYLSVFDIL